MRAAEVLARCTGLLKWTAAGAALEACAGAVLGLAYGAVHGMLLGDAAAGVRVFVYVTVCAAAAGATIGAFIRLSDGCNPLAGGGKPQARRAPAQRGKLPVPLRDRLRGHHAPVEPGD